MKIPSSAASWMIKIDLPAIIGLLLLAAHVAPGQGFDLSMKLNAGVYVAGEPIMALLQFENRTTSDFSNRPPLSDDRLMIELLDARREPVSPLGGGDAVVGPITVIGGSKWSGMARIEQLYPMLTPGRYFATLVAVQDDWRFAAPRRAFDVVPGLEMKSALQLFTRAEIRSRRFSLVYLARDQREILFLKMADDPAGRAWETIELGGLLRISEPRIDIAPDGKVTVLHRATQDVYLKTVIDSQSDKVEVVTQERLMDPASSVRQHMEPFQRMAIEKREEDNRKKNRSWWFFGGSDKKSD